MPGKGFQGPRCGAKTRSGDPCQQPAMKGGVRCRMHGGKSLKGIAHPNYKHGKTSNYMPTRFLEGYATMLSDTELLQQRDEIAQVASMIFESWKKMSNEESGALWRQLGRTWREMQRANAAAAEVGISPEERAAYLRTATQRMTEAGELIRKGAHDWQTQEEILNLIERKRRLIESQGKREVQDRMMISYEDASATFREIAEAIRAEVKNEAVIARIADRFVEISGSIDYLNPDAN